MRKFKYGNKRALIILSFSLLLGAIFSGATLYAMRYITDFAVDGDVSSIINIGKILAVIILLQFVVNIYSARSKTLYINKSAKELKGSYLSRLFNLNLLSISKKDEEIYLNQLTNDMDRYEEKFYMNLTKLIRILMELFVSILILASIHISLLIFALILLGFFIKVADKVSKPIEIKEQEKSSSLEVYTNYIKESLDGFIEVKQNQLGEKRKKKFKAIANKVQDDNYSLDKKTTQIDGLNGAMQMIILFTMIFAGLFIAKKINLSLGTTLIAGTAFANSIWPMQEISPLISQMKGIGTILKDFEKTFLEEKSKEKKPIKSIDKLHFDKLSLGYDDTLILNNINIEIKKGEKILIIGESGVGKSTILKSIRRQMPIPRGRLKVNDIPIHDIYAKDYFKEIAVVDQIGFIFNGSVLDNITLYKKSNKEKISNLMDKVGLGSFDLNTVLQNNGSNISGGQRARLLLARALYNKSSLIICDEIFANLDISVGKEIEKDILNLKSTLVNVSHIIFKENIHLYSKIFLVENGEVKRVSVEKALKDRI